MTRQPDSDAMVAAADASLADANRHSVVQARADVRLANAHAAETALSITDMLAAGAGTAAIFETCTLERAGRDARAVAKHIAMSTNNYIIAGRLGLGFDSEGSKF